MGNLSEHRIQTKGEEHMKIIMIPLVGLMIPVAFVVVAFDIAKCWVEDKIQAKLKEKNGG